MLQTQGLQLPPRVNNEENGVSDKLRFSEEVTSKPGEFVIV